MHFKKSARARKAIIFSPNVGGCMLDKEVLVKGFGHLMGNVMRFKTSHRRQHEGEWPYGLNTLVFLQDYKSK